MQNAAPFHLKHKPSAKSLIGNLALKLIKNRWHTSNRIEPDENIYLLKNLMVSTENLIRYETLCGFSTSIYLPITYPHILAFRLQFYALLKSPIAFSPMGLIHLSNHITQFKAIPRQAALDITTHITKTRETRLGLEITLTTQVFIENESLWQSESIFLNKKSSSLDFDFLSFKKEHKNLTKKTETWQLPKNLGLAYACISEDFNPIHLSKVSAKLFGFNQAIAHGMWSKARCLAALNLHNNPFIKTKVHFKSAIFLPTSVSFYSEQKNGGISFSLLNKKSGRPYLTGHLHTK